MREYITACAAHENAARTRWLLHKIVADREMHARFVNTLARLEYVGVRKILKSRRSERISSTTRAAQKASPPSTASPSRRPAGTSRSGTATRAGPG